MNFTHDNVWENLELIRSKELPLADSWAQFIVSLMELKPKEFWPTLLAVDVIDEKAEIAVWLNGLVATSALPDSVVALWIGIEELYVDDCENEVYAYYLHGADAYEEDGIEWAIEPLYEPEEKYIIPDILNNIRTIIKPDGEDYSILDWILPIAYSSFLFAEIVKTDLKTELFLKKKDKLRVSLGYDAGDFLVLPSIQ